ncbi:hypothetical protein C493_04958 [Natronolimnohabitans innermongolicus JCM 12255]|uniref:Uncharacterized protein n=1 Tax=Natronolimnohabitans innermongolicus JCM 12255 TaxID=1227499 RepID=L9XDD8_9EURY|nr:hypothetical protein C493_04958 [Natronolimnohabitans innermongolicus JCM 12255]
MADIVQSRLECALEEVSDSWQSASADGRERFVGGRPPERILSELYSSARAHGREKYVELSDPDTTIDSIRHLEPPDGNVSRPTTPLPGVGSVRFRSAGWSVTWLGEPAAIIERAESEGLIRSPEKSPT